MSVVQKLAVRGVRSFSPYDEQKIEFFKLLTLILGKNGAGKTVSRFTLTIFLDNNWVTKSYNKWIYAKRHKQREILYTWSGCVTPSWSKRIIKA